MKGVVFNVMRYSIGDGPGIRMTVFLKGCPLACPWCHNPESQGFGPELIRRPERCIACGACLEVCPSPSVCQVCGKCAQVCPSEGREIAGEDMTVSQVMREVEKDLVFYDESGGGVTFSGGEPLAQPHFLLALLEACRDREISTAVDTSGYGSWPVLEQAAKLTDIFLFDLKLMDPELHRQYTSLGNELSLANLQALTKVHPGVVVRIPIIPGITDTQDNLRAMAAFLRPLPVQYIEILPYHDTAKPKYTRLGQSYTLSRLARPTLTQMEGAKEILGNCGHRVKIGGVSNE